MQSTRAHWLSIYIYYSDSYESLLKTVLLPLVQDVMNKQYVSQYFFIRYYDKQGSHIRLRFKGKKEVLETKLKPYLTTSFKNYHFRFVRYLPEYQRYGGRMGMQIAQEQFQASSDATLSFLTKEKRSYERTLGAAMQLHIGMLAGFGITKEEAADLFEHIASSGDVEKFAQHLDKQNNTVLASLHALWKACEQKAAFNEVWFTQWITAMTEVKKKLNKANQQNELQLTNPPSHQNHPLWMLYESYIHMTNNRLGIVLVDEAYLAYILRKAIF